MHVFDIAALGLFYYKILLFKKAERELPVQKQLRKKTPWFFSIIICLPKHVLRILLVGMTGFSFARSWSRRLEIFLKDDFSFFSSSGGKKPFQCQTLEKKPQLFLSCRLKDDWQMRCGFKVSRMTREMVSDLFFLFYLMTILTQHHQKISLRIFLFVCLIGILLGFPYLPVSQSFIKWHVTLCN